jgi:DNA (cytosine-5)-methyltransferase 1
LRLDDPRARTLGEYLRVVGDLLPKVIVFENVPGIAFVGKDEAFRSLLAGIEQINERHGTCYVPQHKVLNAADYGVPQIRSRFFLVAARDGRPFRFPEPRFGPDRAAYRTTWDALADLVDIRHDDLALRGKWAGLLESIPEGKNYHWHTERGGGHPIFAWRSRFWPFLLKLAKNLPSWTIQAQPGPAIGPFHWTNRRLSARELCRLQTVGDDIIVLGNRAAVQRQIGNAVPSLLAEVIAREVRTQLLGLPPIESLPMRMPVDRSPAPPPEPVRQTTSRFASTSLRESAREGDALAACSPRIKGKALRASIAGAEPPSAVYVEQVLCPRPKEMDMEITGNDAEARINAFVAEAGGLGLSGRRAWIFDGTHKITNDEKQIADGAIVVECFARLGPRLKARMLLASMWPGYADVIQDELVWRLELAQKAGYFADAHAVAETTERVWAFARRLDVAGVASAITRYHRLVEQGRHSHRAMERTLFDDCDESASDADGSVAASTPR